VNKHLNKQKLQKIHFW